MEMSLTAEAFRRVQGKVKAEMQRRSAAEQSGSLAQYAAAEWDFKINPETGCVIIDEHVQKLIDPLLHVNDFLIDNSLRKGKSGLEIPLEKIEEFVDKLSAVPKDSTNTGCRGKCTGLCFGGCSGTCNGCDTNCQGGCNNGCVHTCGSGCTTSLKY